MDEYIKRQDAIDALHEAYEARNPDQNEIMDKATMVIFNLPPADVLPLEDISSGVEEAIRHLESTRECRLIDYGSYLHLRDAIYAIKRKRRR